MRRLVAIAAVLSAVAPAASAAELPVIRTIIGNGAAGSGGDGGR